MFDISPLKSHGLERRTQISMAQEKFERSYKKQKETAADIVDISSPEFGSPTESKVSERELVTKAADLDCLLNAMKAKHEDKNIKTGEKIQMMTLASESQSRKKVSEYSTVSKYIVREAQRLGKNKGTLLLLDKKKGKGLSLEVLDPVRLFYNNNKFSRMQGKIWLALATKSKFRCDCC